MKNNAILLCGGIGRRMAPIPRCNKSLLPIRGEVNLIRIIKMLYDRGIREIIIATNPKSATDIAVEISQNLPDYLQDIDIRIIDAQNYEEGCNNVVTLKSVSSHIENTYIIETDQYYLENVVSQFIRSEPYYSSYFFLQRREEEDWGVCLNKEGRVTKILHNNPGNQYYCLSGISYITGDVADYLKKKLDSNTDTSIYWEELLENMNIPMYGEIYTQYSIEYDNISDLINKFLMGSQEVADLIDDNHNAVRLHSMTNTTYKVSIAGKSYALRIPGYGTDNFVNHSRESAIESSVDKSLRPDSTYYSNGSVKLSEFLEGYHVLRDLEDTKHVMECLSELHRSPIDQLEDFHIDLKKEISDYERIYQKSSDISSYPEYESMKSKVFDFLNIWFKFNPYTLVHRDLVPLNIMINDKKDVKFIDWEYSGVLSNYWDLASFCCEFSDEYHILIEIVIPEVIKHYPANISRKYLEYWIAVVDFVWAVWSLAKVALGDDVMEYGSRRYERASCLMRDFKKEGFRDEVSF